LRPFGAEALQNSDLLPARCTDLLALEILERVSFLLDQAICTGK